MIRPAASLSSENEGEVSSQLSIGRKGPRGPRCRTGCATCRIRRVKCDEGKPWCNKCTSTGRKCEGYPPPPSLKAKAKPRTPPGSSIPESQQTETTQRSITLSPNLTPIGTSFERRAVSYFRNRTAQALSGYFNCNTWNTLVLYLSIAELSVWHAVVGLSTLHEGFAVG
ncbi:hypothetical protein OIDMADRAFT_121466, partial [Oidiodendron maius Zn]